MSVLLAQSAVSEASTFSHYAALGILLLMAIGFAVANIAGTTFLGPSRKGETKGTVYESGMNPIGSTRRRFNVRFFIVAMTFLLFDVEIVFLYPWAVTFPSLGGHAAEDSGLSLLFLGRMMFFVLTTVIAFVYACAKASSDTTKPGWCSTSSLIRVIFYGACCA